MFGSNHSLNGLLRPTGETNRRVTFIELFYDLVYVFAITQISHLLLHDLSWRGAFEAGMLFVAVWWSWINTAWFTNWFDPDKRPVRLLLLGMMLVSLFFAASIPEAFGTRALAAGIAFAVLEVGRTGFAVLALRDDPPLRHNFQRIFAWHATVGVFAVLGGLTDGGWRDAFWIVSLAVMNVGAIVGFWTPGLGRSSTHDWASIGGSHMAERGQLFLIIALGESILSLGGAFAELEITFWIFVSFVIGFVSSVALWRMYFARSAEDAAEWIAASNDPGRLARSAYTYLHAILVVGIIVVAVGDELSIADPRANATLAEAMVLAGGPAIYVFGHLLFKLAVFQHLSLPRAVAVVVLLVLIPIGALLPLVALAALATLVLLAVVAADAGAFGLAPAGLGVEEEEIAPVEA